jgi:hypothetical protein
VHNSGYLGAWNDATPLTSGSYLSLRTDSTDDLVVMEVTKYYGSRCAGTAYSTTC